MIQRACNNTHTHAKERAHSRHPKPHSHKTENTTTRTHGTDMRNFDAATRNRTRSMTQSKKTRAKTSHPYLGMRPPQSRRRYTNPEPTHAVCGILEPWGVRTLCSFGFGLCIAHSASVVCCPLVLYYTMCDKYSLRGNNTGECVYACSCGFRIERAIFSK